MLKVEPLTLTGRIVRLEPLSLDHLPGLAEAGNDESIWKYMRYGAANEPARLREMVENLLALQKRGTDLPFTVIEISSGKPIGMTRYLDIQPANRAVEIGGTWYGLAYQHTRVNTECKFLLLCHAFETLGCIRVQFKADQRNERSLRAIERIGAIREGVLRDHVILTDGTVRSSVYFSILAREWPVVKLDLIEKMNRTYPAIKGS